MRLGIVGLLAVGLLLGGCGGYAEDASQTVFQETKVSTLLNKYEWFKDASAKLDSMKADIEVMDNQIDRQKERLDKHPSRTAEENMNLWEQQNFGTKAAFNSLASQYNASMAKINYAFCNVGQMPNGLENREALPRNYRTYLTR